MRSERRLCRVCLLWETYEGWSHREIFKSFTHDSAAMNNSMSSFIHCGIEFTEAYFPPVVTVSKLNVIKKQITRNQQPKLYIIHMSLSNN